MSLRGPPLLSCLPPRLASRDAEAGDSKTRGDEAISIIASEMRLLRGVYPERSRRPLGLRAEGRRARSDKLNF